VTELGFEVMRQGQTIFDELRDNWARQIGSAQLERLEAQLTALVGRPSVRFDTPGWITQDQGEEAGDPVVRRASRNRRRSRQPKRRK
jgi:hypothetical protein